MQQLAHLAAGHAAAQIAQPRLVGKYSGFRLTAKFFLGWAQRWIADRERTRHWYEEPAYRRARRPIARTPVAR